MLNIRYACMQKIMHGKIEKPLHCSHDRTEQQEVLAMGVSRWLGIQIASFCGESSAKKNTPALGQSRKTNFPIMLLD